MLYKLLKPLLVFFFTDTIEKNPSVTKSQFLLEVALAFMRSAMVCLLLIIN